jgi:hypothetical protein
MVVVAEGLVKDMTVAESVAKAESRTQNVKGLLLQGGVPGRSVHVGAESLQKTQTRLAHAKNSRPELLVPEAVVVELVCDPR